MSSLDVVMSKYSFNSSSNKNAFFNVIFLHSEIAKNFMCGKIKCSYLVNYGISPYFFELLESKLRHAKFFVALFDESFNHVSKMNQYICFGCIYLPRHHSKGLCILQTPFWTLVSCGH